MRHPETSEPLNDLANRLLSRRELLHACGMGLGALALGALGADQTLADEKSYVNPLAPRAPHFAPRAKRVIHLFMNGGPSQVDTFDRGESCVCVFRRRDPHGGGTCDGQATMAQGSDAGVIGQTV